MRIARRGVGGSAASHQPGWRVLGGDRLRRPGVLKLLTNRVGELLAQGGADDLPGLVGR